MSEASSFFTRFRFSIFLLFFSSNAVNAVNEILFQVKQFLIRFSNKRCLFTFVLRGCFCVADYLLATGIERVAMAYERAPLVLELKLIDVSGLHVAVDGVFWLLLVIGKIWILWS
jgi:hypothetical protein